MFVVTASKPASTPAQAIPELFHTYPALSALVIATIFALALVLWFWLRARRSHPTRRPGSAYAFPKRRHDRDLLRALAGASPVQAAILKYIIDGYLEGVDATHVAQHLGIRRAEAAKQLKILHRSGLLYIRKCRGDTVFYLIESVMARIGEPTFFTMIGLAGLGS